MSVGVALRAADGVVVIADGRTSAQVTGEVRVEDAVKITPAPHDLPFVAIALGRASVNGVSTNEIVAAILDELPYEALRAMDLGEVSQHLMIGMVGANASCPQMGYDEHDEELRAGFHILVAGYGSGLDAQGRLLQEVWTATVPTRGRGPQASSEGVTMCGGSTSVDALVYDLFDGFGDAFAADKVDDAEDYYRMRGLSTDEVAQRAVELLRESVEHDRAVFDAGGVGGKWLVAEVGTKGPPTVTAEDIGPRFDAR